MHWYYMYLFLRWSPLGVYVSAHYRVKQGWVGQEYNYVESLFCKSILEKKKKKSKAVAEWKAHTHILLWYFMFIIPTEDS